MPLAATAGVFHSCPAATAAIPHVGGPIVSGDNTVLIGGEPAARMGDPCVCIGPPSSIVAGSPTVLIGGLPAARLGDPTAHGGTITGGVSTVMIGG